MPPRQGRRSDVRHILGGSASECRATLWQAHLLLIVSITLVEVMGTMSIGPALPGIAAHFALSPQDIGWVTTAFVLPILIGAPVFGVLADRVGRKIILVPSLFLFAIAGVASAFAPTFETLLVFRFLQGIGAASLEALALALLADLYFGQRLTRVMGINAAMIAGGLVVYPLVAGALASFDWRYVFTLPVLAILVGVWMWIAFPEPSPSKSAAFSAKDYSAEMWRSLNRRDVFWVLALIALVFVLLFGPFLTTMPMFASVNGASEFEIGALITVMALSFGAASVSLGWLSRKTSKNAIVSLAFVAYTIALAITPSMANAYMLAIPSFLFGIGHGLIFPITQAVLAEIAPKTGRAGFMAIVAMAVPFGQTVGPVLAGAAFGEFGFDGVFLGSAAIVGALALLSLSILTTRNAKND